MSERLGEIAYNAYCEDLGFKSSNGQPLPHWRQLDQLIRSAWIAAAKSVSDKIANDTARG